MAERWPRDDFTREVWESGLKPNQRLVALAYADHAADQDHAWVTYPRLMERTGLSRDAIARALEGLRETGWLVLKEAARQQRSARYWLRGPNQQSVSQTAEGSQPPVSRTAETPEPVDNSFSSPPPGVLASSSSPSPELSSPSPELSSPGDGPDQSSHYSADLSIDAREPERPPLVPAGHRRAVIELVARHGARVTEADAADATAWVAANVTPSNLAGYMSSFNLEDVHARAAQHRDETTTATDPRKCPHGTINGHQVLGRGTNASRRCDRCESTDPAETRDRGIPRSPTTGGRSNDIDWEAAAARAAARDAATAAEEAS